ncbi:MAG: class F sortase [Actinomycetota bacterium]
MRRSTFLALALALCLALFASACSTGGDDGTAGADNGNDSTRTDTATDPVDDGASEAAATAAAGAETGAEAGVSNGDELSADDLASRIVELDTALDVPGLNEGPQPVAVSIPSVGVDSSPIDGVGVEPNGELEVPEADRVGWYEYGSAPGQAGSSVLAAHIAYNGENGAFRYLDEAEVGDRVEVEFSDGSTQAFEIIEMAQYDKDELPFDRVFARDGEPVITLITCGGDFQPSVDSYEDNVVAYAVPVA